MRTGVRSRRRPLPPPNLAARHNAHQQHDRSEVARHGRRPMSKKRKPTAAGTAGAKRRHRWRGHDTAWPAPPAQLDGETRGLLERYIHLAGELLAQLREAEAAAAYGPGRSTDVGMPTGSDEFDIPDVSQRLA